MNHLAAASPAILAAFVVMVISLNELRRARQEARERKTENERRMTELGRELAGLEAATVGSDRRVLLRVTLDLRDVDTVADIGRLTRDTEQLIVELGEYESRLGGSGMILTEAKATPGQVVFTLTPVDSDGADLRLKQVADALNSAFDPVPATRETTSPPVAETRNLMPPAREAIPNFGALPSSVLSVRASKHLSVREVRESNKSEPQQSAA